MAGENTGLMGSVMNMFKTIGGATITPPPGAPVPPANPAPTKVAPNATNLGADQNNPTVPAGTGDAPVNPLDAFKDVWATPEVDPNAPKPQGVDDMFAGLTPEKLRAQAATVDFTKSITPEMLAKINAGGPEAMKTMLEAMNEMSRNVYAQSAAASIQINKTAAQRIKEMNAADLPSAVKRLQSSDAFAANEALNHPVMQPVVGALREQFVAKNPNASASEINQQISNVLGAMGQVLNPAKVDTPKGTPKSQDWGVFMEGM